MIVTPVQKPILIPNHDIVVKKEIASNFVTKRSVGKNAKFTIKEDHFLRRGIAKYGAKSWSLILKDKEFDFHPSRTRDALRMRADTNSFKNCSSKSNIVQ